MAMTVKEAGDILRRAYNDAPHGEKKTCLILFGIKYADSLLGLSLKDVVAEAGIGSTYYTEIRLGIKSAQYAQIKPDADLWL